ncbi:MAG TPA: ATP-grasp domain-containing protein [Myxococcaceae bacterium]|nr:ATP-grasp domain-containing protein [Myxococcaceae bacterium]
MRVCVLYNRDHDFLADDPGREAREDVVRVAEAVAGALEVSGAAVEMLPVAEDAVAFVESLRRDRPDVVVNLCESLVADSRGEMAVPCLLDLIDVPYTGSSALALGLALHKHKAKELLSSRGIPTPEFRVVERVDEVVRAAIPFPAIVKPCREDASAGIDFDAVVNDRRQLARAISYVLRTFEQPALVERYIDGREIYVPILGNAPARALPLTEIQFGPSYAERPKIVSYRAKWDANSTECLESPALPCTLDRATQTRLVDTAMEAFEALECRDYGRVDIRLATDGTPYVIDINPNCDLHPSAGFARAAQAAGTPYPELVLSLVEIAIGRHHGNTSRRPAGSRAARGTARPNRDLLAGRGDLRARAHRLRAQAE